MVRCPRCRENGRTLVRFGVYLCPRCGETDPDGVPIAGTAEVVDTTVQRPSGAVFAAPPPASPAIDDVRPSPSGGPPRVLVVTVIAMIVLDVIAAAGARSMCSSIAHLADIGVLLATLSGRPWARSFGILSAMLEVVIIVLAFALAANVPDPQLALLFRLFGTIALPITVFWVYVLMRSDVTAYFARNAR